MSQGEKPDRPEAASRGEDPEALLAESEIAFSTTKFALARDLAAEALERYRSQDDKQGQANALASLGAGLAQLSRYKEALMALRECISLFEGIGHPELAGRAYNYIAIVFEELGDFDTAQDYYLLGLDAARSVSDLDIQCRILANLGDAFVTLERYDEALPYLEDANNLLDAHDDFSLRSWTLLAIGKIHMARNNDDLALDFFENALREAERGLGQRHTGEVQTFLGTLYGKLGNYETAVKFLDRALEILTQVGARREIEKTHLALAEVHERFGNLTEALVHQKAYHRIFAEVYDEVAHGKIESLTAELELQKEKHEREISRLRNVELGAALEKLALLAEEKERLSQRDSLTGAYNRRHLDERLATEFERARRYQKPLSVAMLDADHFKQVNDEISHAVGDEALRRIAEMVTGRLRRTDIFARYGGEEFVIVFPETPLHQAITVCESIRAAIEAIDWKKIHEKLSVTMSFGVSENTDYADWEKLVSVADERLYVAKRRGRNRVVPGPETPGDVGDPT